MGSLAGEDCTVIDETQEILVGSSQYEDIENQRPTKRLRVDTVEEPESEYDLPSNKQLKPAEARIPSKPKHLIHVPEFVEKEENVFITQLDNLNSSPSRMRGPRWRKKSPKVRLSPNQSTKFQATPEFVFEGRRSPGDIEEEFGDDDDDLAVMAAIESLNGAKVVSSSTSAPTSFRQTTLFGHFSPKRDAQSTQQRAHNWPLASRNEPQTHHKLDQEALKTWVYPTNLGSIRDYQFNITARALYHNLLVALPTGLGKTFIAATVMLNWFRWTQDAQIVFVAPTKPLVAQQIDACFHIAGIPRSQTTMLVGNVQPAIREAEWKSKRVFFMTPQTLINDLKAGICDPKRIVLVVVDEAHRAKGGYAYVQVVKFLRRFNNSFRVLALTATPGSTVEAVQEVIDGLDISRVEIRTEESLDIRRYVQLRNIEPVLLESSDEITTTLELFSNAVRPVMNKLTTQNAYWQRDPASITLYGLLKSRDEWNRSAGRNATQPTRNMVNALFSLLMKLAYPLELLKYHGIGVFYHKVKVFESEALKNKGANAKAIVSNEHWKKMMNRLQVWVNNPDFEGHPKLTHLKDRVLNHFMDAGEGQEGEPTNTRIMVFSHYRESVEEITKILNRHQPMVRAHVFVGQAASKSSEGMDQKKQQEIVDKFKKGAYNTLVATSIGEEGLDIGEVDLIICYDASKSPIRLLQRMGRTGRKRAGNIYLLLMKGKEERDYEAANDNYLKMQQKITSGKEFTFHDHLSMRIVPKEVVPVVDKKIVDIPLENTQANWLPEPKKGRKMKRPEKKFHMPDGVETGFTFLGAGTKTKKKDIPNTRGTQADIDGEAADVKALEMVCLSPEEEIQLEERYAQVPGDEPQYIQIPRLDAHPETLRRLGRTSKVGHSLATRKLTMAYRAMVDSQRDWTRPGEFEITLDVESISNEDPSQDMSPLARPTATSHDESGDERSWTLPRSSQTVGVPDEYDDNDSFIDDGSLRPEDSGKDSSDDGRPGESSLPIDNDTGPNLPFYVSQESMAERGENFDEELPDFGDMVTARKQAGGSPVDGAGRGENGRLWHRRREKAVRVLSDSDE